MNIKNYYLILILLTSCSANKSKISERNIPNKALSETEIIAETFSEVDSLLKIDNGKFWNHQLYGPILIIDPNTRIFFANENDLSNKFKEVNSVFTDTLPNELNIANTAVYLENKRWSMIMSPLPEDKIARNNLVIHELFHRLQPEIGFDKLQEQSCSHLDTYKGRLLLKLELQALKRALTSNNGNSRKLHLKNALTFRHKRQSSIENASAENSLEINEGLAEYTSIMLSGRNDKQMIDHLTKNVNQFYENPTFVRSFAYQTIPIYGYLLSKEKNNWQREISKNTNLTEFFTKSFDINPTTERTFEQIAQENDYDYKRINKTEKIRETERLAKIAQYKQKFLKEPTLKLHFENMNISFDPRNITPLEDIGTVYPNLRVTDNFGILTVENGALLSSDWSNVVVSAPTEIKDNIVKGNGWVLELSKGWKVETTGNKFELKKE